MLALREELILALTSGKQIRVFVKMHVRASHALCQHCAPRDSLPACPPSLEKLDFCETLVSRAHTVQGPQDHGLDSKGM